MKYARRSCMSGAKHGYRSSQTRGGAQILSRLTLKTPRKVSDVLSMLSVPWRPTWFIANPSICVVACTGMGERDHLAYPGGTEPSKN